MAAWRQEQITIGAFTEQKKGGWGKHILEPLHSDFPEHARNPRHGGGLALVLFGEGMPVLFGEGMPILFGEGMSLENSDLK